MKKYVLKYNVYGNRDGSCWYESDWWVHFIEHCKEKYTNFRFASSTEQHVIMNSILASYGAYTPEETEMSRYSKLEFKSQEDYFAFVLEWS